MILRTHDLTRTRLISVLALAVFALVDSGYARAAEPDTASTRRVIAGERYGAGWFHRFFLGDDYRHLWTTPVVLPVLDLQSFAGGLTPVKRVGGQQTLGLAMKGADGGDYTFRGIDKDPSEILPEEFHGTFVDDLAQDQIAASLPGGATIVPPLMVAAGVLHTTPQLVVMPDDPLLGEFQSLFAGVVGTIEEYPQGGTNSFGATEIITGAEMWKRMDESPFERPDARAFLTARLVDLLIGDWDRHRGQWRWARIPGLPQWQPIPEDRDQAFVRFEGFLPTLGRAHAPQFVRFGEDYPGIEGLTWNGRDGDRRILSELDKPAWDEVAKRLQERITDSVITAMVARLPDAYRTLEEPTLEAALRQRRDGLLAIADRFYYFLARDVDVRTSDQAEAVSVTHTENGDVDVRVETAAAEPVFHRRFHPGETDEVRLYLGGGDDALVADGPRGKITVRVIGGDGDDSIDDRGGTGLRVSDASGTNDVQRGSGTRLDTNAYTPPPRERAEWIPPRDWGRKNVFIPLISANSDLGVVFLAGLQSTRYGFRKDPYASRQHIRVAYATRAGSFGADYTGEFHRENSDMSPGLYAQISGLSFLHFYGFGNETTSEEDEDFYKIKHTDYVFTPSLSWPLARNGEFTVRVPVKYSKTDLDPNRLIGETQPYGSEEFFQVGAGAGIELDTRESVAATAGGVRLQADGTVYPTAGAVESTFGEVHGEVSLYQPLHVATTMLALRAGGKQVWGTYPYHEAAYVGGGRTVRGFPQQRFAGDASLFGSAELRIPIARIRFLVPGDCGVFALGDAGRVFVDGESSSTWHTAAGGGLWLTFIDPANTASLSIAASEEGTRAYLRIGLGF